MQRLDQTGNVFVGGGSDLQDAGMAPVEGGGGIGELGGDADGHHVEAAGVEARYPAEQILLHGIGSHRDRSGALQRLLKPELAQDFARQAPQLMQSPAIMNRHDGAGWIGAEGREMDISADVRDLRLVLAGKANDLQPVAQPLAYIGRNIYIHIHTKLKQRPINSLKIAL